MKKSLIPWAVLAVGLMIAFLVWLGSQMSRSERGDEILIILVICFALGGLAFGLGMMRSGRRRRDR